MITKELLQKAGVKDNRIDAFLLYLQKNAEKYEINTKQRIAAFLAQILHESGRLAYVREIWGPTPQQKKYERDFTQPYKAGLTRNDRNYLPFMLGNEKEGDGRLFAGRGLIQVTGRTNYAKCSQFLFGGDRLLTEPQLLESPEYAVASAFWFCIDRAHLLDEFDSAGIADETKKVNGGTNGIADRQAIYDALIA